jgi:hypothetical protein
MGVKLGLTLIEEQSLRVLANRVLGKIFVPLRDDVTGGWRNLNNEVLQLYGSPNIITVIKSRRMSGQGR